MPYTTKNIFRLFVPEGGDNDDSIFFYEHGYTLSLDCIAFCSSLGYLVQW